MSQRDPPEHAAFLLKSRGTSRDLDAFVVAARFSRDGRRVGFALGDGTVRLVAVGDAGRLDRRHRP